ncbi:MAG: hypothetical protein ABJC24_00875 [Chloroflexota bacterium]
MLVDYRLHPAILAAEDRVRGTRDYTVLANRGTRRIFRVGDAREIIREMGRR